MIEESKAELTRKRAELVEILAPSKPLTPEDRVRFQGELSILNAKIKAINTAEAAKLKAAADRRKIAGMAEAKPGTSHSRLAALALARQREGTPNTLKADDVVYRVVEYDPPEEGVSHTWRVESRVVKQASAKQITLKSYFSGHFRIQYNQNALGRLFFATPALAIEAFAAGQCEEIESLDHKRKEIERALAWAYSQGAKAP